MRNPHSRTWIAAGVAAVILVAGIPAARMPAAQQIPGTYPVPSGNRQPQGEPSSVLNDPATDKEDARIRMEQQRDKLQIDDRQKHLLADTARLVQLSNELKDEVDKSGKYVTSVAAMRKAEEIEKLAHSVRDRMKN